MTQDYRSLQSEGEGPQRGGSLQRVIKGTDPACINEKCNIAK